MLASRQRGVASPVPATGPNPVDRLNPGHRPFPAATATTQSMSGSVESQGVR